MAYALKKIKLLKIYCSTPDQTCQIYIELVFLGINTAGNYSPASLIKTQRIKR